MQEGKIVKRNYAADKPSECRYCYFWRGKRKGCGRTECFYLLSEGILEKENLPGRDVGQTIGENGSCQGCAYGKHAPCIGYCIKKLLLEMKQKKRVAVGKEENQNAG